MLTLSKQDFDQLALQAAEILGFQSGATVAYDVAGYDRCPRTPVAPGDLPARAALPAIPQPLPTRAQFAERAYLVRLAGFRRRDIFGPDEIGELMQAHKIPWSDGLGNGLYESLLICRKYGLSYVLEAPILGFQNPFLEAEWAAYRQEYPRYVERLAVDVHTMEAVYGAPLMGDVLKLVILWQKDYPLAHFQRAYRRDPQGVGAAFTEATGMETLPVHPGTPAERAGLMRFWNWIRREQAHLAEYQAEVLRAALGPQSIIIANPHELPVLDFAGQGRAFDYPSVAIRPLLVDDPVMLRQYIAYFSQLYHDLAGKPPMVSVRMNLSAATPQFVPTGRLMRLWYDQAVRHGAGGFYFWTRDYPSDDNPDTYDGPIPGNPVASTLPRERWEASLDILGRLATHRRFLQPQSEVAILVPLESALLHRAEWRRIYAVFSALAEARIFARFVSDQQVAQGGLPAGVKALLIPHLEFLSPALQAALQAFTRQGGLLLSAVGDLHTPSGAPAEPLDGITPLDPALLEVFPLGKPARPEDLRRLSVALRDQLNSAAVDALEWVFDVGCDNLPLAEADWLRAPDPGVYFAPWMYEHGSEWIMPYLRPIPPAL